MVSIRVYADTSVFGGPFDEEFDVPSRDFFTQVRQGRFRLLTSALVEEELAGAPEPVRELFSEFLPFAEIVEVGPEILAVRSAYLDAGIVSERWAADALHVAIATVSGCSLIVSWNFSHIVHFQKIPLYNAVNRAKGYHEIGIYSPLEIIRHEEDQDI